MKRLLTASLLIPFFLWVVLFSPQLFFLAVVAALACVCFVEFWNIGRAHYAGSNDLRLPIPGLAAGLVFLFAPNEQQLLATLFVLLMMIVAMRSTELRPALPFSALFALGLLYVFGCWRAAISLHALSPWWLLFATAINWVGDTFAYYAGRTFGRHKLAPRVSPAKTWEGAIASLASTLVLGYAYLHYFFPQVPMASALLLCAAGNLSGQVGDLAESAFKRGAGVKDSGTWLPGHGGWLDRVDSTLFSMPVVAWLLQQSWLLR